MGLDSVGIEGDVRRTGGDVTGEVYSRPEGGWRRDVSSVVPNSFGRKPRDDGSSISSLRNRVSQENSHTGPG